MRSLLHPSAAEHPFAFSPGLARMFPSVLLLGLPVPVRGHGKFPKYVLLYADRLIHTSESDLEQRGFPHFLRISRNIGSWWLVCLFPHALKPSVVCVRKVGSRTLLILSPATHRSVDRRGCGHCWWCRNAMMPDLHDITGLTEGLGAISQEVRNRTSHRQGRNGNQEDYFFGWKTEHS
jgi:hypothetical protein